jgi:hypothetical protein
MVDALVLSCQGRIYMYVLGRLENGAQIQSLEYI